MVSTFSTSFVPLDKTVMYAASCNSNTSLFLILISNKMLYLKSRVLRTLVAHVPCVTASHKNLTRFAL